MKHAISLHSLRIWGIILSCALFHHITLFSQPPVQQRELYTDWATFVEEYFPTLSEEDETYAQKWMEELEELYLSPVNLNRVGREELLQIPLLNEAQADSILAYRERHRRLVTLGELQFIRGVGHDLRRWLSLFVYAGDTLPDRNIVVRQLTTGRHEIETRVDIPLYLRAGYDKASPKEQEAHPSRYFIGEPWAQTLRYRYRHRRDAAYGMTLQKDAGEPFAARGNTPYDHMSAYAYLRPRGGRSAIWLGDYRVRTGSGLLLAAGGFHTRTGTMNGYAGWNTRVTPHTGSDEADFLRGIAAQVGVGRWTWTAFVSYKRADGTLTETGDSVLTLHTDGLHRTLSELANRRTLAVTTAGGNASYYGGRTHLGVTGYWQHYSRTIAPRLADYNRYYLRGRDAAGLSSDYRYAAGRWVFTGEVAADCRMHPATIHTIQYTPDGDRLFTLQTRCFSSRYVAPMADPDGEGTVAQNEWGVLLGATLPLSRRWKIAGYIDAFRFPRTTFLARGASFGFEGNVEAQYAPNDELRLAWRYRVKAKQQNVTGHIGLLEYVRTHRMRFTISGGSPKWTWTAAAHLTIQRTQTRQGAAGWMLSGRTTIRPVANWRIAAFSALFFTDDYATRIYAYEPQLRYAMSFPTFAYHGTAAVISAQWDVTRHLELSLRHNVLHYFNRRETGSGASLIRTPTRNDMSVQCRWRF